MRIAVLMRAHAPYLPLAIILAVFAPVVLGELHGDWFQFWYAGHLIANGGSPYDQESWIAATHQYGTLAASVTGNCGTAMSAACLWLYPPWTGFLFVPFGALPVELGVPLLHVAVLSAGVAALILWSRALVPGGPLLALALAIGGASQPFLLTSSSGHIDAALLLGAFGLMAGLGGRAFPAAIGAVLLSLKPHLVIFLAPIAAAGLITRGRWRVIGASVAAILLIALGALIVQPFPVDRFFTGSGEKLGLNVATIWSLGRSIAPAAPLLGGLALASVALVAAGAAYRWAGLAERDAMLVCLGLAISRTLAPYAHTYDDLLDFPAVAMAIRLSSESRIKGVLLATLVVGYVIYPWLAYIAGRIAEDQAPSAVTPFLVLGALAVAARAARVHAYPIDRRIGAAAGGSGAV